MDYNTINTTKHLIKTENPQPHMQTFDKITLNKMVIYVHVYTKTYYTKNDTDIDIEQTFNTQFDAAHKLLKKFTLSCFYYCFQIRFSTEKL